MYKLLIASNNKHKAGEIKEILKTVPVELIVPGDINIHLEVTENGKNYFENSFLKARSFYAVSGIPTLADDSGLEVDLLDGAPGIFSHRFSPEPQATDLDRCVYLLERLKKLPQPWIAAFHCEVVIFLGENRVIRGHGICNGKIIPEFRGENGFGYDPIFLLEDINATMAEIPDSLKNKISHRAKAIRAAMNNLMEAIS